MKETEEILTPAEMVEEEIITPTETVEKKSEE